MKKWDFLAHNWPYWNHLFKKNSIKHIGNSSHNQLMKKYTGIALIGVLVVGIAGFISLDAISATSFVTMKVASDVQETGKMIGHVTYELRGADGNIKHYSQSDNVIVDRGTDCAATAIFDTDDALCPLAGNGGFAFIAIGNATGLTSTTPLSSTVDIALLTTDGGFVNFGDPNFPNAGDEIDRSVYIDASITEANSAIGDVTTVSIASPQFQFLDLGPSGTVITQSGLFDSGTLRTDNMFSAKDVPGTTGSGLAVSNADTLSVTWTITLEQ